MSSSLIPIHYREQSFGRTRMLPVIRSNIVQLFASKSGHDMVENQKRKQDKIQRTHRGGVTEGRSQQADGWVCLKNLDCPVGEKCLALALGISGERARARG